MELINSSQMTETLVLPEKKGFKILRINVLQSRKTDERLGFRQRTVTYKRKEDA